MAHTHHNPTPTFKPRAEAPRSPGSRPDRAGSYQPLRFAQGRRASAFTLVEMIVAVGLTVAVFGLANYVFTDAVKAVRRGADTSQIIAESRTLSDTIFEDAKEMIVFEDQINRPGEPGAFLVIVQQINGPVLFPIDPTKFNQDPEAWLNGTTGINANIRTDQLIFFRIADRIESVTPGRLGQYSSQAKASYARIFYGHVEPDVNGDDVGNGAMDRIVQLNLGRQALLLVGETDFLPDANLGGVGPIDDDTIVAAFDPTTRLAHGTAQDPSNLTRIDRSQDYATVTRPYIDSLFDGSMDVLWVNFGNMFDEIYDPTTVAAPPGGALTENQGAISSSLLPTPSDRRLPTATYFAHALSWAYLDNGQRLTATQSVPFPFLESSVGQTHSLLLPFVSDFTVDFAADITDDLDLVTDPTGNITGSDNFPDQTPDTDDFGRIKWYNAVNANPDSDGTTDGNGDPDNPDLPLTWPLPNNTAAFNDGPLDGPYHTRLTRTGAVDYPPLAGEYDVPSTVDTGVTRPVGGVTGANVITRAAFVFGHTSDEDTDNAGADTATTGTGLEAGAAKWWPYMIRIRYRLHDADATFNAADPVTGQIESGRWFEQIIPIPRPI